MMNPEDILKITKSIEGLKPELTKLIDEFLKSAGLTKDANYEGALPIVFFLYTKIWPLVKELASIEHATYAVLLALYNFLGGIAGDVLSIPKDLENFFKKL